MHTFQNISDWFASKTGKDSYFLAHILAVVLSIFLSYSAWFWKADLRETLLAIVFTGVIFFVIWKVKKIQENRIELETKPEKEIPRELFLASVRVPLIMSFIVSAICLIREFILKELGLDRVQTTLMFMFIAPIWYLSFARSYRKPRDS